MFLRATSKNRLNGWIATIQLHLAEDTVIQVHRAGGGMELE